MSDDAELDSLARLGAQRAKLELERLLPELDELLFVAGYPSFREIRALPSKERRAAAAQRHQRGRLLLAQSLAIARGAMRHNAAAKRLRRTGLAFQHELEREGSCGDAGKVAAMLAARHGPWTRRFLTGSFLVTLYKDLTGKTPTVHASSPAVQFIVKALELLDMSCDERAVLKSLQAYEIARHRRRRRM